MGSKETLHRLVDALPEDEASAAELFLEGLLNEDPMLQALAAAPIDDEVTEPEEDAGAEEAWQEYREGKSLTADEARRCLL